ncbi:hypothetical protein L1077_16595 [Pseudoalteromonas luteoviolacea]|uniref:hypothetical protein n=1 Tax=Pseudoalteromonas luteoviolacea TaxID=43657 RepID=UPI001F409AB7|nr:hypothetical protein [Pseudoalteromonas luteoviolacea]MCF6441057.1 hypothetical protein [Pseudoalteromonas luteoviolacea]
MNMSPISRHKPSSKKFKVVASSLCVLILTAGVSIANEESEKAVSVEKSGASFHARNGGPSLPPVKPNDDKTLIDTIRGVFG